MCCINFSHSCEVTLTSNTGEDIGTGLYLGQGKYMFSMFMMFTGIHHSTGEKTDVEKRMYARILLVKLLKKNKTDIELPSPLETKQFFHQLEVRVRH